VAANDERWTATMRSPGIMAHVAIGEQWAGTTPRRDAPAGGGPPCPASPGRDDGAARGPRQKAPTLTDSAFDRSKSMPVNTAAWNVHVDTAPPPPTSGTRSPPLPSSP
jgi:hypothetical protein